MKRNPNKLSSYDKTYFAIIHYAHAKLTVQSEPVIILTNLTAKEAQREVFQFNSLRKSLEYYAPNHKLTRWAKAIKFYYEIENVTYKLYVTKADAIPEKLLSKYNENIPNLKRFILDIPKEEREEIEINNPSLEHPPELPSNPPSNDKYLDEIFK